MIQGRCPTCSKSYRVKSLSDLPSFPFCSPRCKLVDLGRWIDGKHTIPGPSMPQKAVDEEDESGSHADSDLDVSGGNDGNSNY
jgi:endogenous inhibitor of DNA gyrase (YacG/DUF329 family)